MKILDNLEIVDLALKYKDYLIISDLHIGLEEALNKQGVLIPRFQFKELKEKLSKLLTKDIKTIVINGDLKHEFGVISEQEWRHVLQILDLLLENDRKVVLIKGNHDTILEPIAKKRNVEVLDKYEIDGVSVLHGNKIIDVKNEILVIGHEHPAINIKSEVREETYKCFLKGKYNGKMLIVMPSFNFISEGSNVLNEKLLSPYLEDIKDFEVYVVSDKVYNFGEIKDLK